MSPIASLGTSLSTATFVAAFLYSSYCGPNFPKISTIPLVVAELLILAFCEFGPLSNFGARKLCHSFSGFMMLHLDPADALARYFVYSVALSSLVMVWEVGITFKFRYAKARDVGISVYLILVVIFFYNQIPLEIIKPVFFADPLGALVGRYLTENGFTNPRWVGDKTVGGTCAVFLATLATLGYGGWGQKLALSVVVAIAEGLSKDYDNLFIAAIVIAGYVGIGM
eukprot:GFUD01006105.1.p1 GENE.GFUD01006105.1~~GFUD01006105.1.p1  ORF type:complete len:226 (-),score=26.67 GFUD01006105.1:115-792(-)